MSLEQLPKKAKIIKASYVLQAKVGAGPLDENTVERCQRVIDNNDFDFAPLAKQFLSQLANAITEARAGTLNKQEATQKMTEPVMQLKANAAIFKYHLIGNLANVMLSFLEAIKELDNNVIAIVEAHHKTLSAIVANKMKGDGGPVGKQMEEELKAACKRYFAKAG